MMAYGRLDVFFPDGLFKTYLLTDPNTTIGRFNANTIPLEDDTLSRYHANITFKSGKVAITDMESENGTFVEGVRLEANTAHELVGGEEIFIGDLRMIYATMDDSPTRPIEVPEETTQRVELPDVNFFIEIADSYQSVAPGAHISTRISVTNLSDKPERFTIEITGLPREWVRIDKPELEVAAGKNADITLSFKPLRRSDSRPGDYNVQIAVRRKSQPETILRGSVNLLVLPYGGFGMAIDKNRLKAGERFRLFLHNQGSAPLPMTLTGRALNSGLVITLTPSRAELAPGQRLVVQGEAHAKNTRLFGDPRQHSFDILARSGDPSGFLVSARAYVDEKPPLPAWSVFAIGGVGAALIAIVLIGLLILLRPVAVNPEIVQFNVNGTRIAQGEPLALAWTVTNADTLTVAVNGTQILNPEPGAGGTQIDTTSLAPGVMTVSLIASSGSRQVEAAQEVEIFIPLRVVTFEYQPDPLVRYVNQTITISWNVPAASSVQLVGLEGFFTTQVIETLFGAADQLSITGIPVTADPITITLIAQGTDSTTLEQTLALDVIDPQCTTAAGDITLYNNPDTSGQVIGTIRAGTTITVNARTSSGQWLRVQLSGGVSGWGERGAFSCAVTFNVDNLYQEIIVPTAVLPPTLAPTPTPTITGTRTATPRPTRTLRPTFTATPAG